MPDFRKLSLHHIRFHGDEPRVSYSFTIDGEERVLSYDLSDPDEVTADVRPAPDQAPMAEVHATRAGVRARTPEGSFTLERGGQQLPRSTDRRASWLLEQSFLTNATTSPQSHLDRIAKRLPKGNKVDFSIGRSGGDAMKFDPFGWLPDIWSWFGSDDCLNPNQSTTCTEQDTEGHITEVKHTCDCGIPICTSMTMTIEVPVLIFDQSTGQMEAGTETETYTVCMCYCIATG